MILHLKVQAAQSLLYQLACLENDEEVPSDKPTKWKSLCSTILMQKVSGIPPGIIIGNMSDIM